MDDFYALELWNLEEDKPFVKNIFENGGFSVERTGKSFTHVGVDMALE